MLKVVKRIFRMLPRRVRWHWASLIPFSFFEALFESMGAGALFFLIKILNSPDEVFHIPVVGRIYSAMSIERNRSIILSFAVMVVLFYLIKNGFVFLSVYLRCSLSNNTVAKLSSRMYSGYLDAPYSFHLRRNSADLIDMALRSIQEAVRLVLASAVALGSEILVLLGIIAVLVAASPLITIVSVALLSLLLGILLLATHRMFFALGAQEQELRKDATRLLQQTFGSIKEVKVMGRAGPWKQMFATLQKTLARVRRWHETLNSSPRFVIETVFVAIPLVMVLFTFDEADSSRELMPVLALFAYAGFRAIPSFNRVTMHLNNIRLGSKAVELLWKDQEEFRSTNEDRAPDRPGHLNFEASVVIEKVSYGYEARGEKILQDISLTVQQGTSLGIAGETGVGKSTLIDLVLGLLAPTGGRILVDGNDIREHLQAWHRKIGYVPQHIYLFDDTLRRNIAFGVPDHEVDEGKMASSIRLARLESLVSKLPDGLDTVVGERGIRFSGGERQRVAIARALYRDPEILIFDEPSSALDSRTELDLAASIHALQGEKTVIVAAHRSNMLKFCDRIVVLKNGRIEEVENADVFPGEASRR
ncbi:MAG: ABC transporter ATP-binding protein [Deltaproteobacteria bacterium]|nr:ABC transporter ATP-binding protein [Deltaproteobacteria bacterium]